MSAQLPFGDGGERADVEGYDGGRPGFPFGIGAALRSRRDAPTELRRQVADDLVGQPA